MTHRDIFIREFSKFKKKDIIYLLLMTVAINLIALFFDYFIAGGDFYYYLIDRCFINCTISLLLIVFFNNKYVQKYFVYIGFGIYIITGVGQILLLLVQNNPYYFGTIMVVMLAGVPLFFVAYVGTFMINMGFVILFAIVQYFEYSSEVSTWISSVSIMLLYVLLIFFISHFLHKSISSIFFESVEIKKDNKKLKKNVAKSEKMIKKLNYDSIYSLAIIAESHDDFTGKHLQRVGCLSKELAENIPEDVYRENKLNKKEFVENIELASTLHDIGKIDIPMKILKKKGPLTIRERKIIETHSLKGYDILTNISALYENNKVMDMAKQIAKYHHENWDGSGYPKGLKEKEIPLSARIVSMTDYYDALTQDRPYRKALDEDVVLKMMKDNSAVKFDPELLKIFYEKRECR